MKTIRTVKDLKELIDQLDDDFVIEFRVRRKRTEDERFVIRCVYGRHVGRKSRLQLRKRRIEDLRMRSGRNRENRKTRRVRHRRSLRRLRAQRQVQMPQRVYPCGYAVESGAHHKSVQAHRRPKESRTHDQRKRPHESKTLSLLHRQRVVRCQKLSYHPQYVGDRSGNLCQNSQRSVFEIRRAGINEKDKIKAYVQNI